MYGTKYSIILTIVLVSLFPVRAYSQQISYEDSLNEYIPRKANLKPELNFQLGSTFNVVPSFGSVTGVTLAPFLSVPVSPKLSVDGGIIAGHYYSALRNFNPENSLNGSFYELSVYGSAVYHFNPRLTLYGTGIKQLSAASPYSLLPKSSYAIGSSYNFGHFSIGLTLHVSEWNNFLSPFPASGSRGFYFPYEQIPGRMSLFGQ